MNNQNINSDVNPVYDRELEDGFVDCDLRDTGHTVFFKEAMYRLEAMFIPSFMDWHYAECMRKFLEKKGYVVHFDYPFESGTYENAYCKYIEMFDLEEEFLHEWLSEYDRLFPSKEDEEYLDELPF